MVLCGNCHKHHVDSDQVRECYGFLSKVVPPRPEVESNNDLDREPLSEIPLLVKCENRNCSWETEKSKAISRSQKGIGCPSCEAKFQGISLTRPSGKMPVIKRRPAAKRSATKRPAAKRSATKRPKKKISSNSDEYTSVSKGHRPKARRTPMATGRYRTCPACGMAVTLDGRCRC